MNDQITFMNLINDFTEKPKKMMKRKISQRKRRRKRKKMKMKEEAC